MHNRDISVPSPDETGKFLAEFGTGSVHHWAILIGVPLLAAFFLGCWVYAVAKWGTDLASVGFLLCTLILLGSAGGLMAAWIVAFLARHWRLLLFDNGLLYCKRASSRWVCWTDIVRYYEIRLILNEISTGHRLYLYPKEGKRIAVDGIFKNAPMVAECIKARLVPVLTREAEERLSKCLDVDFQAVELRPDGIKTARELVAWRDVESVAVEDNKGLDFRVMIRVLGKKEPWLSVPVTTFPNLEVFLYLIDKLRNEKNGQTGDLVTREV
jgi:hypothetical protein